MIYDVINLIYGYKIENFDVVYDSIFGRIEFESMQVGWP